MKQGIVVFVILGMFLASSLTTSLGTSLKIQISETEKHCIEKPIDVRSTEGLPPYFSWRDRDGVDFVTPIRDQRPFSSCETFAIVAAVETMVQYKMGYPFGCDLSEAHLWFHCDPSLEWGSYPDKNMDYLKEEGIPDEACWPYPDEARMFPPDTTCDCWQSRAVKIADWGFLPNDPVAIKNALMTYGPIPTYLFIYKDFMVHQRGIYRHTWGQAIAPHMVTIVGYNDDPGYWIVKNSWGTDWGEDGWFKIEYGQCSIEEFSIYITDVYGKFPIIYVDDDDVEEPRDGTEEHPYKSIQEGIDNAFDGYTVYVNNGTYRENVVINKAIKLKGEDKTNTIIDGCCYKNVVNITAKDAKISDFTIQNSSKKLYSAGIAIRSKYLMKDANATIINNIIQDNNMGIYLTTGCSNIIKDNTIQNNNQGIYLLASINNHIEGNIIQNNKDNGIESEWGQSTIIGNVICENKNCGIYLRGASNNNLIKDNNSFKNNNIGIKLDNSNKNMIKNNNFIDNQEQAIFINSFLNRWRHNYWSDWAKLIPRIIKGSITNKNIPWINIDWLPSKQPY